MYLAVMIRYIGMPMYDVTKVTNLNLPTIGSHGRDEVAEEEHEVGAPSLGRADVGRVDIPEALRSAGTAEVDVLDEDGDPGEETKDRDEVHKVVEDL